MTNKGKIRIGRLANIGQVCGELGRVYRQARRGEITPADASRFANILGILRQCLEVSDVEGKIAALEAALKPDNVVPFKRHG